MKRDTRLGSFSEVMEGVTLEVRSIAEYLRNLIGKLHGECVEVPRPGERSIAYGVASKKISEVHAYIMPHRGYFNLCFYLGAALPDTSSLLEVTSKASRHVKLRSIDDAKRPEVARLILEAITELKLALGKQLTIER